MDRSPARDLQPLLHRLAVLVRAPSAVLSATDGQVRGTGVQGLLRHDRRVLSRMVVEVDGEEPESVDVPSRPTRHRAWWAVCRNVGDPIPDPTVYLRRTRTLTDRGMVERFRLASRAQARVRTQVQLHLDTDLAELPVIKLGGAASVTTAVASPTGVVLGEQVAVDCEPTPDEVATTTGAVLTWEVELARNQHWDLEVVVTDNDDHAGPFTPASTAARPWRAPMIDFPDPVVPALVDRGLEDLGSLLLADDDGDVFVAAGAPWFLTLFGRDSLWVARMLLPLGTDLALGTLRALASRQGTRHDPDTDEQPGKILHEVRGGPLALGGGHVLPEQYYGTIDATPLWIILLVDAWRWGADLDDVAALLPALRAALDWMERAADEGSGLLRYMDESGTRLANQGWKDSGDSIQFADGRLADPPIALIECQAYAHEAAVGAASLLDALDEPGGDDWREWAIRLEGRVRDHYWQDDPAGRYLAIALDADDRPVDALTSNGGHALGTGILTRDEAAAVAASMTSPLLNSPFGLRTLTTASPRFALLSYHGGTVWPHDTAIVAAGLAREGFLAEATDLALGLVEAGPSFDHRLPELYGVTVDDPRTIAYPAACTPQAWAAAAPLAALVAALGIRPDVPDATVTLPSHVDPRLAGLRLEIALGDGSLHLRVHDDASLHATASDDSIRVVTDSGLVADR